MKTSITSGIIGGVLGALGAAAMFALKDERTRSAVTRTVKDVQQKGMQAFKQWGEQMDTFMDHKTEGKKRPAVSRQSVLLQCDSVINPLYVVKGGERK